MVGAGSMGMSAGYELAKRGVKILLIDAFGPPHTEGSHHGETRLIRHAYSGDPVYSRLAALAHRLWTEIEDLTESTLLYPCGVLNIADRNISSFEDRITQAQANGMNAQRLNADEIRRRWPAWQIPDSFEGMYEPAAGILYSEKCLRSLRELALARGADLLTHTRVERICPGAKGSAVLTSQGTFYAARIVVTAGAWYGAISDMLDLPIRAVRKTVGWFNSASPDVKAGRFPGFTLHTKEGMYYGFPDTTGAGLKIGRHDTGVPWVPGEPLLSFGAWPEDERDLREILERYIPAAAGKLNIGSVCKYEMTPDEDFIIDRHPQHDSIWIAGGFSGHGFKFASVIGTILADLALTGQSDVDLSPFSLHRFADSSSIL
ncbi:N-methyl-L-tryptophan oxidase [Paenibacillus lacisoli]|uniref:N-methyl-L-tryptophan oxidase n=1 Tax=Paenibacillus lacisoli TaxID=3064525 RepID=UPI0031F2ED87